MTSIAPRLYADLIGKPYRDGARGPDAYDCLGLAMEMARRLGLEVPDFVSSEEELHRQLAGDGSALASMPRIEQPEPGCVVLLRGVPAHLGVMLDRWWMLHSLAGTNCTRERITEPAWQRRVIGFYRLEGRR